MDFGWDEEKARSNLAKHGVSFAEATEVFGDGLSATVADPDRSQSEQRFLIFGQTLGGRHLVVAFAEGGGRIRLISARAMTRSERKVYEQ